MREKLFNIALCLVVLGAAALTLRQTPAPAAALPIAARAVRPTASPHPVDAYRAARAQENSRIEALLSLLADEGLDEQTRTALREQTPLDRLGSPEDVAQAILYLADAAFVTGQVLGVNGGFIIT